MKMIPIVLCAGMGVRLQPLTSYLPKAAVPLLGKPVAFYAIKQFLEAGFPQVFCNTHYKSQILESALLHALLEEGYPSSCVRFFYEPLLLETGGGVGNIVQQLRKENSSWETADFLVTNGDIYSSLPLKAMLSRWENRSLEEWLLMATFLSEEKRLDHAWVEKGYVVGFQQDFKHGEGKEAHLFTAHQIIGHQLWEENIPPCSSRDVFYRKCLKKGKKIISLDEKPNVWHDIGTLESYQEALSLFSNKTSFFKETLYTSPLDNLNIQEHFPEDVKLLIQLPFQKERGYVSLENNIAFACGKSCEWG